jgi:hypothetical protein
MEWRQRGSPRPEKKSEYKNPVGNSCLVSWNQDVILLIDYLPKVETINEENYPSLLVPLEDVLKEKARVSSARVPNPGRICYCSPGTCNPKGTGLPGLPVS